MHFSMAAYLAALCASALEASSAADTPTNRAVERILEALICSSYGTPLGKTHTSLMGKANRVRCCLHAHERIWLTRSHPIGDRRKTINKVGHALFGPWSRIEL